MSAHETSPNYEVSVKAHFMQYVMAHAGVDPWVIDESAQTFQFTPVGHVRFELSGEDAGSRLYTLGLYVPKSLYATNQVGVEELRRSHVYHLTSTHELLTNIVNSNKLVPANLERVERLICIVEDLESDGKFYRVPNGSVS